MNGIQKVCAKVFVVSCIIFFIIAYFPYEFFELIGKNLTNGIGGIAFFCLALSFGWFLLAANKK